MAGVIWLAPHAFWSPGFLGRTRYRKDRGQVISSAAKSFPIVHTDCDIHVLRNGTCRANLWACRQSSHEAR